MTPRFLSKDNLQRGWGRVRWGRGLRAGVAVGTAMVVSHALGRPMGWAATGGFLTIVVDNGGPYRSRLQTMAAIMAGGALAILLGSVVGVSPVTTVVATAAFCFLVTFARVTSQVMASVSVGILVIYVSALGGPVHTLPGALEGVRDFVMGATWAAALSLVLWPLDPFRPARLEVAECFAMLAAYTAAIHPTAGGEGRDSARRRAFEFQRMMRVKLECARAALGATSARAPSRTVRARSLAVLLENADMLFAASVRLTELAELVVPVAEPGLAELTAWVSKAERSVAAGLDRRPADRGESFGPEGSHSLQLRRDSDQATLQPAANGALTPIDAERRDARQLVEVSFEAVRAVWRGVEATRRESTEGTTQMGFLDRWMEAVRTHWTLSSVMMQHALRMAAVGAVDVALMRSLHVVHASWLPMTSIIVLQPHGTGTMRVSLQRVGGTIAGGILAAVLASAIHSEAALIGVITAGSVLTLATFAVDYTLYCIFLTPTFVLLSLPYLRDWHFAGVRMLLTVLGAGLAMAAMRFLWPHREDRALSRLLGRGAAAEAAYLEAMLKVWPAEGQARRELETQALAPARRACGLATNDAEEALDRLMLEPKLISRPEMAQAKEHGLTFVTYLRRVTQTVTTLAVAGNSGSEARSRVQRLILRMQELSDQLLGATGNDEPISLAAGWLPAAASVLESSLVEEQLRRLERQTSVLERAGADVLREQ